MTVESDLSLATDLDLQGLLMGSVSHKVFHLAPCTCATVHRAESQTDLEGIKSILVPTDGSDHAAKAVDLASDIAVKCGAKLTLLHITRRGATLEKLRAFVNLDQLSEKTRRELDPSQYPVDPWFGGVALSPDLSGTALKEIGEHILARARQAAEGKGVEKPDLVIAEGDPTHVILETAQRQNVDLIAMGSRGMGEVEGLLAGSVSYKVNHAAPCNCMVVR